MVSGMEQIPPTDTADLLESLGFSKLPGGPKPAEYANTFVHNASTGNTNTVARDENGRGWMHPELIDLGRYGFRKIGR